VSSDLATKGDTMGGMFQDRPDVARRLDEEIVAWLTTVSADSQPQPSIVWFTRDHDTLVVYSKDETPRLRNIRSDPRVALHVNSDEDGDGLLIIEGEARIIGVDVPPSHDAAYVAKYERHLPRWDFTWETYDRGFPVRIHITPTRLRT
jgi:PPOX class probable F420-dependent enzyme